MGRLMADVCLDAHNFHVQKTLLDLWSSPQKCLQHDSIIFHFLIQFPSFPIMYLCFTYYSHHFPRDVYKYNKITYTHIYIWFIHLCVCIIYIYIHKTYPYIYIYIYNIHTRVYIYIYTLHLYNTYVCIIHIYIIHISYIIHILYICIW